MKKIWIPFVFVLFFSCIDEDIDKTKFGNSEINIFLVKEGELDRFDSEVDFDTLQLEKTPWLKNSEIDFYDWSAHLFYLKTEKEKEKYSGRHFVIKEDNKPLLLGLFFSAYWSYMPPFPSIIAHDYLFYPNDLIGLGGFGFNTEINISADLQEFRQALENAGFLREGITVEMLNLERKNTTTLKYTIRVTNNDKGNIYVLDPNKMGVGRFHYFTNGVTVRKNDVSYYSEIESIASDEIRTSWYYKLSPHKSMDRTVELNGFTNLPTGNVHFRFSFPGSKVEKGEWEKSDGRIWLGQKYIEGDFELN